MQSAQILTQSAVQTRVARRVACSPTSAAGAEARITPVARLVGRPAKLTNRA
jgi:hypothetical protein